VALYAFVALTSRTLRDCRLPPRRFLPATQSTDVSAVSVSISVRCVVFSPSFHALRCFIHTTAKWMVQCTRWCDKCALITSYRRLFEISIQSCESSAGPSSQQPQVGTGRREAARLSHAMSKLIADKEIRCRPSMPEICSLRSVLMWGLQYCQLSLEFSQLTPRTCLFS